MTMEPSKHMLVDVARSSARPDRDQLPSGRPARTLGRHLTKHQPVVRTPMEIGLEVTGDTVTKITAARLVAKRVIAVG